MNKQEVRSRIEEVGIIPAVRVSSTEDALFAAEASIPRRDSHRRGHANCARSAQSNLPPCTECPRSDRRRGQRLGRRNGTPLFGCRGQVSGSDGLDPEIVTFAVRESTVVIPGTLTPSEVMSAWKLGPDFVKVVPCAQVGGDSYIRSLKAMFPDVPLIAAGGVNQQTASSFILAGAMALGIGAELIPREAIRMRQPDRIAELARRFTGFVSSARRQSPGR